MAKIKLKTYIFIKIYSANTSFISIGNFKMKMYFLNFYKKT